MILVTDHRVYRQLTPQEIEDIRRIKFKDVLLATTNIEADNIQKDVFKWKTGKYCQSQTNDQGLGRWTFQLLLMAALTIR